MYTRTPNVTYILHTYTHLNKDTHVNEISKTKSKKEKKNNNNGGGGSRLVSIVHRSTRALEGWFRIIGKERRDGEGGEFGRLV